jgi:type II restriction endonuclease EcoO109I-like protein
MDENTKQEILEKAKAWMREELVPAHKENTLKLTSVNEFTINPFLWKYLANFKEGNSDYKSLATVLVLPRVLGTSINTSFGQRAQSLVTRLFEGTFGSPVAGIDIEFTDKIDGRKKYCQLKAGPNVVNRDDVVTVKQHFRTAINQGRLNQSVIQHNDYMFCLLYGEEEQKNSFVRQIETDYIVSMGKDFWHRFTGDADFYSDLINAMGEVAHEIDMKETVEEVIDKLAEDVENEYGDTVGK